MRSLFWFVYWLPVNMLWSLRYLIASVWVLALFFVAFYALSYGVHWAMGLPVPPFIGRIPLEPVPLQ